jgi:hypothetical protein
VGNPGVYQFKRGFGGVEMLAPGPFELVPNAMGARIILRAERIYRRLRNRGRSPQPAPSIPAGIDAVQDQIAAHK